MIHAGIDGFTRSVVYIKCSSNNCATTVIDAFLDGISNLAFLHVFVLTMVEKTLKYGSLYFTSIIILHV